MKAKRFATESMRLAKGGERMKEILEMVRLSRRQMEALFPRLPGGSRAAPPTERVRDTPGVT